MGFLQTPRVQISLINAYATHDDMLRGILDYVRGHARWEIDLRTGRRDEPRPTIAELAACDGIIVNETTSALLRTIRRRRLPAVLVSPRPRSDFPGSVLSCDNLPIAELAIRHLMSRHCASYAVVGINGIPWASARGMAFANAVQKAGAPCVRWTAGDRRRLARQIKAAEKPLGVFAADDVRAREVLDCCRQAGCSVPDEVIILGVDNDETLCEMSSPTLSSIPLSTREAGFRAAELLDRAMRGELAFDEMSDIGYTGTTVVERQSTARSLAKDSLVRRCRELLEAHYTEKLPVSELAKRLHVSRRTLETHYRTISGSTISADILTLRIARAKHLLAETEHSTESIALACGFCDASHLCSAFRQREGQTPTTFRKQPVCSAQERNLA